MCGLGNRGQNRKIGDSALFPIACPPKAEVSRSDGGGWMHACTGEAKQLLLKKSNHDTVPKVGIPCLPVAMFIF